MTGLRTVAALHTGDISGPMRTLTPVLRHLGSRGPVTIVVPRPGSASAELAGLGRVEALGHEPLIIPRGVRALGRLPVSLWRDVKRFRALLRAERADLVLVATTVLPALTLAARLERVPAIVYATELYRQGASGDELRARVGRVLLGLNARLAGATVAPSEAVAGQVRGRRRPVVVPPSIVPDVRGGDPAGFRRRHALPEQGPCIATLGNISRGRGQDIAIRALDELRRDFPAAHLVIAGAAHPHAADQIFEAELRELVRSTGDPERVRFVGVARPGEVFGVCDVLVNPARVAESFGRAPLEALLAGRPVVSTDVGAVSEAMRDGRHALLVPPDDPAAIADAARRLLRDPALARRLADAGREHVLTAYGEDRQVARFTAVIDAVLP